MQVDLALHAIAAARQSLFAVAPGAGEFPMQTVVVDRFEHVERPHDHPSIASTRTALVRLRMDDVEGGIGDLLTRDPRHETALGARGAPPNRQPECRYAHGKVPGAASGCLTASAAAAPSI